MRQTKSMVLEAANRIEAVEIFQREPLGVIRSVTEVSKPFGVWIEDLMAHLTANIGSPRIDTDSYIATLRQIGTMLDAGIAINITLEDAIEFTDDDRLATILSSINAGIQSGKSMTDSAKPFREQLGFLSLAMFRLGESTGMLSGSILKLADIVEKIEDNRRMLIKATRYPIIVIIAMVIAFVVVILMVIPQFQAIFAQSQIELPLPTRLLLWIENAAKLYGPYILGGAAGLSVVFSWFYKHNEAVRLQTDRLMLRMYIVGIVTRYAMLGRYIYILQVVLDAGVPFAKALETAETVIDNKWLSQQLGYIHEEIESGHSFYEGFQKSAVFEPIAVQMIKSGEDSGSLDLMLEKINKYYQDRYQYIVDNVSTMIEPLLIGAIAGFVLVLALGIFLPMWNLAAAMGLD